MLWDTYVDVVNPSGKLKDLHKDIQYVTLGKLPLKEKFSKVDQLKVFICFSLEIFAWKFQLTILM